MDSNLPTVGDTLPSSIPQISSRPKKRSRDNFLSCYSSSTHSSFDLPPLIEHGTASTKPPYSYAQMIIQAILASPEKRLTLSEIYAYIINNFPYYKAEVKGWQNSIRHNLSLTRYFLRSANSKIDGRKGSVWSLDPQYLDTLTIHAYIKRRYRGTSFERKAGTTTKQTEQQDSNDGGAVCHETIKLMALYGKNSMIKKTSRRPSAKNGLPCQTIPSSITSGLDTSASDFFLNVELNSSTTSPNSTKDNEDAHSMKSDVIAEVPMVTGKLTNRNYERSDLNYHQNGMEMHSSQTEMSDSKYSTHQSRPPKMYVNRKKELCALYFRSMIEQSVDVSERMTSIGVSLHQYCGSPSPPSYNFTRNENLINQSSVFHLNSSPSCPATATNDPNQKLSAVHYFHSLTNQIRDRPPLKSSLEQQQSYTNVSFDSSWSQFSSSQPAYYSKCPCFKHGYETAVMHFQPFQLPSNTMGHFSPATSACQCSHSNDSQLYSSLINFTMSSK